MDFYDDMEFDGFDDEFMYEDDGFEFEAPKNGAAKPVSDKKKALAKAAVKAIAQTAAKAEGLPPSTAKRKAAVEAQKAIAKVERELYEGSYEDEEDEYEYEDMLDPELLAEMDGLAEAAATTDDEAEADEFLGALGAIAAKAAPMLMKAAPGIISSLLGEDEYENGYAYEDYYDEEGDEFLPVLAGIASSVLPKIVQGVGRLFRSRGARRVIKRLPRAVMGAVRHTARSGVPTAGNFARHLGVQTARAVMQPTYGGQVRRRPIRRHSPSPYTSTGYRTVCRRVPLSPRRPRYRRY